MIGTVLAGEAGEGSPPEPVVDEEPPSEPPEPPEPELAPRPAAVDPRVADDHYIGGLTAWNAGDWAGALVASERALLLVPDHRPARLLKGSALLRLGRSTEGVAVLESLEKLDPSDSYGREIRRRADAAARRYTDRRSRDQLRLTVGSVTAVETAHGQVAALGGYVLQLQAPIRARVAVRAEVACPWAGGGDGGARGPRFSALGVGLFPLGSGIWNVGLSAGPSIWLAQGPFWPDGSEPFLGARATAGLDVRLTRGLGLGLEAGTGLYPGAIGRLPWYGQPVDLRLMLDLYAGP